jgi:hypothetical protein
LLWIFTQQFVGHHGTVGHFPYYVRECATSVYPELPLAFISRYGMISHGKLLQLVTLSFVRGIFCIAQANEQVLSN